MKSIFCFCGALIASILWGCLCIYMGGHWLEVSIICSGIVLLSPAIKSLTGTDGLALFALIGIYIGVIWYPELWVLILNLVLLIFVMGRTKNKALIGMVGLVLAYIAGQDISFFLMGDPFIPSEMVAEGVLLCAITDVGITYFKK